VRLLGIAAHPADAAELCGRSFARYAAEGTQVTLLCAGADGWSAAAGKAVIQRLGVRDLVLLDYTCEASAASDLEAAIRDVLAGMEPHVVVADQQSATLARAALQAFSRVRHGIGGSAALPAKFYYRAAPGSPAVQVTTAISVGHSQPPELFIRAYPTPWVTGVVERDLFAGIADGLWAQEERLAS
jgi:LmbE family N-acetylglucosaminyl deacetylase